MASAIGITRSAYSNYESGDREVPYDVIEKASDFFGCEMAILFEENENVDAMILAAAFRIDGLSPEDAKEIRNFKDVVKSYIKMTELRRDEDDIAQLCGKSSLSFPSICRAE